MRAISLFCVAISGMALSACDFTGGKSAAANSAQADANGSTAATDTANNASAGSPAATGSMTPLRPGGTTMTNPSQQDVVFLYYSLAHQKAPLDDWASKDAGQLTSDEFAKAKKAAEIISGYQKKLADAGTVGKLLVDMSSQLGEYDGKAGEFPIEGLGSSNFLSYYYNGSTVKIAFANGEAASHWKLSAADAEAAFKRNQSSHGVTLEMNLDIVGVDPAADGGTIRVKVTSYKITSPYGHQQLGSVTL